jgi:hypothetical protein
MHLALLDSQNIVQMRFGHSAVKKRYVTEDKLRKREPCESLRDFGQAIEDLYRRAYPGNPEIVEENSIKAFLDKCGQSEDCVICPMKCSAHRIFRCRLDLSLNIINWLVIHGYFICPIRKYWTAQAFRILPR